MDRIGIVRPGEIKDPCMSQGKLRVLAEKCPICPFRANSSFNYQLKGIIQRIKNTPEEMQCHDTYPSDVQGAVCRGSFDTYPTNFTLSMVNTGNIDFIDHPNSAFKVLPYGDYPMLDSETTESTGL